MSNTGQKKVKVATCSAADLLAGKPIKTSEGETLNAKLAIPEYQRPYTWKKAQIDQLIDGIKAHKQHAPDIAYYLGSLIVHHSGDKLFIIDGQQRITTLAIMAYLNGQHDPNFLHYESPTSRQQIAKNFQRLKTNEVLWNELVVFDHIEFSLVITDSEDDAYRFFETQNTGGVRLSGPDIIKAHHLRAINEQDKSAVNRYAQAWEAINDLTPVVDLLIRGRYWQKLQFRSVPEHKQLQDIRTSIVKELAHNTQKGKDIAFNKITRTLNSSGAETQTLNQKGYDLRQPLNSGVNTIHYLQYFEALRQTYLITKQTEKALEDFSSFYHGLVNNLKGCGYLKQLFDTSLLLYISQYGEDRLAIAAKKIFRVVYSLRVSNPTAVKEKSIPKFIRKKPVLDWIALSYTVDECFEKLDSFELKVDASGFDKAKGVKNRFVGKVAGYFELVISKPDYSAKFGAAFDNTIRKLGE